MHVRYAGRIVLALLIAGPVLSAQMTWSVDAGGGGDFLEIADALASPLVADGDTLHVSTGTYAGFTLDRDLTIVGDDVKPQVTGPVTVQTPAGATLSRLRVPSLHLLGCQGVVLLHRMRVAGVAGGASPTFLIENCQTVLSGGGLHQGKPGDGTGASPGLIIRASDVWAWQGNTIGGAGFGAALLAEDGAPGIVVESGSTVRLSHLDASGGAGGTSTFAGGTGGDGAPALRIEPGATCIVAGHDDSPLLPGAGGGGAFPGQPAPFAIDGGGDLTLSGLGPTPLDPALTVTVPDPLISFLRMLPLADPEPAPDEKLQVYGPPGQFLWLLGSLVPAHFTLPGLVDGPLYLDPTTAFLFIPVTALTLENPVTLEFEVPENPSLTGVVAHFQAFADREANAPWQATNPVHIVVN